MNRHPQWDQRLHAFVEKNKARHYAYGEWDCLLFLAGAIRAVTGRDLGRGHRGKYKSAASAARYLQQLGADSPEAYLDLLFEEKHPGFAHRGDVVLASDGIPALCMGAFAFSVGQEGNTEGLVRVPRADWVKAWRVG
jgi:hypothetical protein